MAQYSRLPYIVVGVTFSNWRFRPKLTLQADQLTVP